MKLQLFRTIKTSESTAGVLYVDGVFECHTIEDIDRKEKVHGKTAIPKGSYKIIINQSNRFKRLLPLLLNVPGFEGIRIHPGNTSEDTEGCILPGVIQSKDFVGSSKIAFERLFNNMQAAEKANEQIYIEIL